MLEINQENIKARMILSNMWAKSYPRIVLCIRLNTRWHLPKWLARWLAVRWPQQWLHGGGDYERTSN